MADFSKIAWTDSTFNPWMGCTKVSPGCKFCYAEFLMDSRYGKVKWGPQGERIRTSEKYWKAPLRWNKDQWWECLDCGFRGPTLPGHNFCPMPECDAEQDDGRFVPTRQRVFCASLADVFEDNPQVEMWRVDLLELISITPNLDWLVLTKRPENIGKFWSTEVLDNLWLGTSVESNEYLHDRMESLLENPAKVHFLSVEPMIGPVEIPLNSDFSFANELDWIIVGGESGKDCRPFYNDWARSLLNYCRSTNTKFFMKQLGGHPNKRDKMDDFPTDLMVREFPE